MLLLFLPLSITCFLPCAAGVLSYSILVDRLRRGTILLCPSFLSGEAKLLLPLSILKQLLLGM